MSILKRLPGDERISDFPVFSGAHDLRAHRFPTASVKAELADRFRVLGLGEAIGGVVFCLSSDLTIGRDTVNYHAWKWRSSSVG